MKGTGPCEPLAEYSRCANARPISRGEDVHARPGAEGGQRGYTYLGRRVRGHEGVDTKGNHANTAGRVGVGLVEEEGEAGPEEENHHDGEAKEK